MRSRLLRTSHCCLQVRGQLACVTQEDEKDRGIIDGASCLTGNIGVATRIGRGRRDFCVESPRDHALNAWIEA